jgi:biotin carboxyl carrier protein
MLKLVRQFLKNNSPDWLNTEVNKDLLQNLSAPLTKGGWGDLDQSPEQVKPSLNKSLPGERSLTKSDNNDRPLMRSDCLLNTAKGKPHWRRINQVFQTLDTAPENATYNQLIEYVRLSTGIGCSRKLISKWKKQNTSHKFPDRYSENRHLEKSTENAIAFSPTLTISSVNSFQFTETLNNSTNNNSLSTDVRANGETLSLGGFPDLRKVSNPKGCSPLITVKTWSYLTAAGLMVGLVGCEIIPLNNNQLTENIAFASVTTPLPPLPPTPETRKNRLEPNNIKIELTLSNPQDLKVKPGDKVTAGQTLSNRASERNRLQAKKKQLQLSIEKLNLPLTPIPQPRPIPDLNSLPPVSYAEEEAAIKLHKQKLTEANRAIALQQKKIDSINQLHASPLIRGTEGDQKKGSTPNLKLILEHEQANLKNLETAKTDAQIQLEVQESQLTTAKEQRTYIEYQRQLEQTRRAIAISQQHQDIQRTESERQVLLAEREYSIAQIETQIQEIDYQIEQLSTVKAPYEGTIKKVKWTGQSDHTLTAVVTLSVTSEQSSSVNSHQSSVISENESVKTE